MGWTEKTHDESSQIPIIDSLPVLITRMLQNLPPNKRTGGLEKP
jgi:hypothetical protein